MFCLVHKWTPWEVLEPALGSIRYCTKCTKSEFKNSSLNTGRISNSLPQQQGLPSTTDAVQKLLARATHTKESTDMSTEMTLSRLQNFLKLHLFTEAKISWVNGYELRGPHDHHEWTCLECKARHRGPNNEIAHVSGCMTGAAFQATAELKAFAEAPLPTPPVEKSALARFRQTEESSELKTESALERLRYFCSLALSPQDWLDVEFLFDEVESSMVLKPTSAPETATNSTNPFVGNLGDVAYQALPVLNYALHSSELTSALSLKQRDLLLNLQEIAVKACKVFKTPNVGLAKFDTQPVVNQLVAFSELDQDVVSYYGKIVGQVTTNVWYVTMFSGGEFVLNSDTGIAERRGVKIRLRWASTPSNRAKFETLAPDVAVEWINKMIQTEKSLDLRAISTPTTIEASINGGVYKPIAVPSNGGTISNYKV